MKKLPETISKRLDLYRSHNRSDSISTPEDSDPPPPRPPLKKWLYPGLGVLVLLSTIWALRPTPIAVDLAKVATDQLRVTVNAEGKTRVRDRYLISADVAGRLGRIQLEAGDTVRAGAIVARIDPLPVNKSIQQALAQLAEWQAERAGVGTKRPKVATLEQAQTRIRAALANQRQTEAKVAQARAALAQAQRDRQRAQDLAASGAISRQQQETAELNETSRSKDLEATILATKAATAEVEVAQAALRVLQQEQRDPDYLLKIYDARIASVSAELAKLQDDAKQTEIRSPVSGRVLRIHQRSSQYVREGTPLIEIADPGKLEVVIDVLSSDALKISPGNLILIDQGGEANPRPARVRLVEPSAFTKVSALGVEEQRVNVIGDLVEPHRLGDAYRIDSQIIVWQGENVLQVPLSALFRCHRSRWCTFVVKDGQATEQQVEIGHRSDVAAEVLQGLRSGDLVVLHPTEQIKTGSKVIAR